LGDNFKPHCTLFYKSIFQKGAQMKKIALFFLIPLLFTVILGCAPLIIGGAVGALGGYVVSRDTLEAETDIDYDRLWGAALTVARIRGTIKSEDFAKGYLTAEMESSKVWIRLVRVTRATIRIRISARKYHLPNLTLAQDLFMKIMEQTR
jgi:hypothetical protein